MKHRKPDPFILLAECSNCREYFQDGRARHMLGTYPMEQFCTYACVEGFLDSDPGLTRALPLASTIEGKVRTRYLKRDEGRSLSENSR